MRVFLALPTVRDFPADSVISLLNTVQLCEGWGIDLLPCIISGVSTGAFDARNLVAHEFLKTDCTHIFWVDSDMTWQTEDFFHLLRLDCPVAVAVCPTKQEGRYTTRGLAFACIARVVMEQLAARAIWANHASREATRQIFRCEVRDGQLLDEDVLFCRDVAALGYEIKSVPGLSIGHIGVKEYR